MIWLQAPKPRVTLTYLQWEVSRRPQLQAALREELLSLNSSGDKLADPIKLDTLPLLGAILKETLRLYPPSPPLLTRLVPPGGTTIEGYKIPTGTFVGTSAFVMHMNQDVYPDPFSFKPERWIVDGPKKLEMNRWFWVFGSGGRMCIGSHFALYMLKAITAAIYTTFETEVMDDGGPWAMELIYMELYADDTISTLRHHFYVCKLPTILEDHERHTPRVRF